MWTIVLKDGTRFSGKRSFWNDGWGELAYVVKESETLPIGSIIVVPSHSVSYRVKGVKDVSRQSKSRSGG